LSFGFDERIVMRVQLSKGAFVVDTHQAPVVYDIGRKNSADPLFGTLSLQRSLRDGVAHGARLTPPPTAG
jgi:hypothetical protein